VKTLKHILLLGLILSAFSASAQYRDPAKVNKKDKNRQGSQVSFKKKSKERKLKEEDDAFMAANKNKSTKKKVKSEPDPFGSGKNAKREKKYKNKSKVRKTQATKDPHKQPKARKIIRTKKV
jgi:hypothetical protein